MIKKNILSITVTVLIIYLSLAPADNFSQVKINIPYFDKFIHFMMYLTLMSVIIFENRKKIKDHGQIFLFAIFPVVLGITLEILQMVSGSGRTGNLFDVFANITGVFAVFMLWVLDKKRSKPFFR